VPENQKGKIKRKHKNTTMVATQKQLTTAVIYCGRKVALGLRQNCPFAGSGRRQLRSGVMSPIEQL